MQNVVANYLRSISSKFSYEETSEMGYRADLEVLLKSIFDSVTNAHIFHDSKSQGGNKPDFIVLKDKIPLLYLEVKDIGSSLDKIEKSEQMSRYFGYTNLVLSDYIEFRFYRNGLPYGDPIKIADYNIKNRTLAPISENYEYLSKTLIDFTQSHKEPIKSATHLAKIMGGKGQRLRDNVRYLFDINSEKNDDLEKLYKTIKELLVSDLTPYAFADMYAQTLVYGLFVARYHDDSLENFTRLEARELIPNSNRFLKRFFDHIVGAEFKSSLKHIVDELCEVFSHADVNKLMAQYFQEDLWGEVHTGQDPVVHFYEDFLKEYDPELRKKMGAYYTPLPVVQFIVRSVDNILKKEFNLAKGLAESTKNSDGVHKVQILDPAVGTGTFLSETIEIIYKNFLGQEGRWPAYVHNDLLPRLYGFELMMTPYTIAHLKLGIQLKRKGFWDFHRRLGIYLTNSLEVNPKQEQMFAFGLAESIAEESKEASEIKEKKPIMVVLGNPPYSISSSNKSKWILELIKIYKNGLNEQNLNALSDDYVKFIRLAEHFVEKNGSGIVAMITNNSFIDGITHRQMRKHLLETFDDIYILDLHGNSKKKEKTPDDGKDENVFDIQQGVSISIFIRTVVKKKGLGKVHHAELYGKRKNKFMILNENDVSSIKWKQLNYTEPYYFFVPKDFNLKEEYNTGFKLDDIFVDFGSGIKFRKDNLLVKKHFNRESVEILLKDMNTLDDNSLYERYDFNDTSDWKLNDKRKLFIEEDLENIKPVQYRPFDTRYTYYPLNRINEIIPRGDSRTALMANLLHSNMALLTSRNFQAGKQFDRVFLTKNIAEIHSASDQTYVFTLYLYSDDGSKIPNLKKEIVDDIEKIVGKVSSENIFDYVYAVLHSPDYRKKYKEFLKIDFPRIPYPKNKRSFKKLVEFGTELRQLHLLESPKVSKFITTFLESGSDTVEKLEYRDRNIYINDNQYFGNVPQEIWDFYIGGYQPAQKWLKDRKGRKLINEDIEHYQKMIVALVETEKLMKEIDKINLTS